MVQIQLIKRDVNLIDILLNTHSPNIIETWQMRIYMYIYRYIHDIKYQFIHCIHIHGFKYFTRIVHLHTKLFFYKAVISDEFCEESSRSLGCSCSLWVCEIYMVNSKLLTVTLSPLKVVQQRPHSVTEHVTPIHSYCWNRGLNQ